MDSLGIFLLAAFLPILPTPSVLYLVLSSLLGLTALAIVLSPRWRDNRYASAARGFCESWLLLMVGVRTATFLFPSVLVGVLVCLVLWVLMVTLPLLHPRLSVWLGPETYFVYNFRFHIVWGLLLGITTQYVLGINKPPTEDLVIIYKVLSMLFLVTGILMTHSVSEQLLSRDRLRR